MSLDSVYLTILSYFLLMARALYFCLNNPLVRSCTHSSGEIHINITIGCSALTGCWDKKSTRLEFSWVLF